MFAAPCSSPRDLPLFAQLVPLALEAGRAIMAIYQAGLEVSVKADQSPVTEADETAERIILAGLAETLPGLPVIAEEAMAAGHCPDTGDRFILVDPLDGTKEFISGNGEFTVNIALIEHGRPRAGVVYAPATQWLCYGESGAGAWQAAIAANEPLDRADLRPIHTRGRPPQGLTVVASRSHRDAETDAFLAQQPVSRLVSAGSSLKFCLVASGDADLYPRFGRTMEWDVAAGHAVLEAAGGSVVTVDGAPLTYGKRERGFANPGFIARGWPAFPIN
ncbi:3'(2'),5'-bisphosphate nucleotidase CysQ [Rhodoligotrophos defluvii]|uniref:3'(2'),5'-bisphosphate nucleotidase CysQ n=1 Tax=Rhodoligotrophos defluvii TaxID=2561934 RepID=UPI0010C9F75F|nr:3'(2'),5'-bisphosphate nucleotidase CysQ [Rhodoligotrophos defluvii]